MAQAVLLNIPSMYTHEQNEYSLWWVEENYLGLPGLFLLAAHIVGSAS